MDKPKLTNETILVRLEDHRNFHISDIIGLFKLNQIVGYNENSILDIDIELSRKIIELILLRVPLPKIILELKETGDLKIINGKKILDAIYGFYYNKFELKDSLWFEKIENTNYSNLVVHLRRRFNELLLDVVIIDTQTPEKSKKIIIELMNEIYKGD